MTTAPRIIDGGIGQAYDRACRDNQPVFVPIKVYTDARGWSIMNQLTGVLAPEGQVNYSAIYPAVIKAWHRHERQTDFWLCVQGHLKTGVHRETDGCTWTMVIGERRPGILIIPPTLWHGLATVGPMTAGMIYYVTRAYDPADPDEERRPFNIIPGFSWKDLNP